MKLDEQARADFKRAIGQFRKCLLVVRLTRRAIHLFSASGSQVEGGEGGHSQVALPRYKSA